MPGVQLPDGCCPSAGPSCTRPYQIDEQQASRILKEREIAIRVDIGNVAGVGGHSATYYTSDLSVGYVEINSDYRS